MRIVLMRLPISFAFLRLRFSLSHCLWLCPRVPLQVSLGQLAFLSLAYFLFVFCLAAWFSSTVLAVSWAHLPSHPIPSIQLSSCLWQLFSTLEDSNEMQTFPRQLLPLPLSELQTVDRTLQMMCQKIWITCWNVQNGFFKLSTNSVSIGIPIGLQPAGQASSEGAHSISSPIISVNKSRDCF